MGFSFHNFDSKKCAIKSSNRRESPGFDSQLWLGGFDSQLWLGWFDSWLWLGGFDSWLCLGGFDS